MNQQVITAGKVFGMGLSHISSVHLHQFGFMRDKNYFIRINSQDILIYRGSVKKPHRQAIHENSLANLRKKRKNEGMSSTIKRKIMNNIHNWFDTIDYAQSTGYEDEFSQKKYLGLITLTLPVQQFHDDRHLKRYGLMMFIKALKKKSESLNYLWKAETQKNGNIHFHIIIDEFIDKEIIQHIWYSRLKSLGYMDAYEKISGKNNPPATNVESLRDKRSAGAYVAKYFNKSTDVRRIEGRIWGCSDKIRELASGEVQVQADEIDNYLNTINVATSEIYVQDFYVKIKNCQGLEKTFQLALDNYYFDSTMKKNMIALYSYEYQAFSGMNFTKWEQDIIEECNQLNALYLFENDMIDI